MGVTAKGLVNSCLGLLKSGKKLITPQTTALATIESLQKLVIGNMPTIIISNLEFLSKCQVLADNSAETSGVKANL